MELLSLPGAGGHVAPVLRICLSHALRPSATSPWLRKLARKRSGDLGLSCDELSGTGMSSAFHHTCFLLTQSPLQKAFCSTLGLLGHPVGHSPLRQANRGIHGRFLLSSRGDLIERRCFLRGELQRHRRELQECKEGVGELFRGLADDEEEDFGFIYLKFKVIVGSMSPVDHLVSTAPGLELLRASR